MGDTSVVLLESKGTGQVGGESVFACVCPGMEIVKRKVNMRGGKEKVKECIYVVFCEIMCGLVHK